MSQEMLDKVRALATYWANTLVLSDRDMQVADCGQELLQLLDTPDTLEKLLDTPTKEKQ